MSRPLRIVFAGLSITSSWGNGHATTYRALVRGLSALGHRVLFLERDVPWYRENRDDPRPEGCVVGLYGSLDELERRFRSKVRNADAVIVGSYVPQGAEVVRWVTGTARGLRLFYDIDTPVTLEKLLARDEEYLARESIPRLDGYLSFTGGPTLQRIERTFGASLALPLYCSADAERYAPSSVEPTRDLGYLGTYSADRQPTLDRLLLEPARRWPSGRFVVAGPCYPESVEWPANVARTEHVAPGDHPSFYGSQRFTLNVTRKEMARLGHSPSVRLFEAAACGVPILSDRWAGIDEFFEPGREILLADSSEGILDVLERLGDDERRAIGRRARQRVLSEHTGLHRARTLESYLLALFAGESRPFRERDPRAGDLPAEPTELDMETAP